MAHKEKNKLVQPVEANDKAEEPTKEMELQPLITPRAGIKVMIVISIGLVALLLYSAPKDLSWGTQIRVTAIVLFSTWLVFGFAYTLIKWIRSK